MTARLLIPDGLATRRKALAETNKSEDVTVPAGRTVAVVAIVLAEGADESLVDNIAAAFSGIESATSAVIIEPVPPELADSGTLQLRVGAGFRRSNPGRPGPPGSG